MKYFVLINENIDNFTRGEWVLFYKKENFEKYARYARAHKILKDEVEPEIDHTVFDEEEAEILSFSVEASFDGTSTTSTDDTTSSIDYDGGSEFISVDTSTDISATDSGGTVFVVSTSEEEKVEPVPEPIDIEEEKEVLLEEIEEMEEELVELDPEEMEEGSILDGIFEEEEEIDDEPVIRDDIEKIPREEPEEE